MNAKREPEDADDRRRACESIHESLVVEASAGTGKTTLLVARIVNLLRRARVDRPPRPVRMDEIVAITFTEKAAAELKSRLRNTLEALVASGQPGDDALTEQERRRLAAALDDLDQAAVSTIHSFCAALIRERPVEAGIDPGRSTADELTQSLLFDEAWELWREEAFQNPGDAVLGEVLRLDVRTDRHGADERSANLRDLARRLVENRDLAACLPQPIDEAAAWADWRQRLDQHAALVDDCLNHVKGSKEDKAARLAREFLDHWQRCRALDGADARRALNAIEVDPDEGGDHRRWKDPDQLSRLKQLLKQLRDTLLPDALAALTHNTMVALVQRLGEFLRLYERLKEERGLLDFQDLLLGARDLLKNSSEARRHFRERFKFLLIDEFQDTDPLQAEVVFLLAAEPSDGRDTAPDWTQTTPAAGSLFIVGDPKQSIYRFRRADIEIYDQSQRLLGSSQRVSIQQNFRSASPIVLWVNRVFQQLIRPSTDGHYQPAYVPLIAGPHAPETPGGVVLLYPPEPDLDRAGTISEIRYREGCAIALFIKRAVQQEWETSRGPLRLGDVAVLLQQTTGIEAYEEAFRTCNLPYHIVGGKHFYQRLEIRSLVSILTAIDNPEDGIAVVAALRSPFFGCSDEDFLRHALANGKFNYLRPRVAPAEPLASCFALLERLHRDRNSRPVAHLLIDLFDATKGLELFLAKPQGQTRVANLMKVVESALSLERTGVLTFRGFVRWLRERQAAREETAESPTAEPDDDSVEVLTIHKAKGLEFPMTIIADLSAGKPRPDEMLIFDRLERCLHLRCGPVCTQNWRQAELWDRIRVEAEWLRLFYVAATRARDYLVLPVYWRKLTNLDSETGGMHRYLEQIVGLLPAPEAPPWGETRGAMRIFDTRSLPPWPQPEHAPRVNLEDAIGDPSVERFLVERTEWQRERDTVVEQAQKVRPVLRASELVHGPSPGAAVDRSELPHRPGSPADRADFGTLVHRLLELHLSGQVADIDPLSLAKRLAADARLAESQAQDTSELVASALRSPTVRRLRAASRLFLEVPFAYTDDGRIVEGRIDAVAEEPAGLVLVDFKTDRVQPGAERACAEAYALQVRAYAAAVRAATGRPVQAAILLFLRTMTEVRIAFE